MKRDNIKRTNIAEMEDRIEEPVLLGGRFRFFVSRLKELTPEYSQCIATDIRTSRSVILQIYKPENAPTQSHLMQKADVIAFLEPCDITIQDRYYAKVAPMIDAHVSSSPFDAGYIVFERHGGKSLADILSESNCSVYESRKQKKQARMRTAELIADTMEAVMNTVELAACHDVFHGSLTTEHICITEDGVYIDGYGDCIGSLYAASEVETLCSLLDGLVPYTKVDPGAKKRLLALRKRAVSLGRQKRLDVLQRNRTERKGTADGRAAGLLRGAAYVMVSLMLLVSSVFIALDSSVLNIRSAYVEQEIPELEGKLYRGISPSGDAYVLTDTASGEEIRLGTELFSLFVDYEENRSHATGTVLSQSPKGLSQRKIIPDKKPGQIKITVSREPTLIELEPLEGLDISEAIARLERLGLNASVEYRHNKKHACGTVYATEPTQDSTLSKGDTVTLFVSTGELN